MVLAITENGDKSYCQINIYAGNVAVINWAALYEGEYTADTLPPYVPKGYVVELAECQRYFTIIPKDSPFYGIFGTNGGTAYADFPIPQKMRISKPSTSFSGKFYFRLSDGSTVQTDTIVYATVFGNVVEIKVSVGSTLTDIPTAGYVGSSIELNADL